MTLEERATRKRNKDLEKLRQMGGDLSVIAPLEEYVRVLSADGAPLDGDALVAPLAAAVEALTAAAYEVAISELPTATDAQIDDMVAKVGVPRRTWSTTDKNRPEYAVFNSFEGVWEEPDAIFKARLRSSSYFEHMEPTSPTDFAATRADHADEMNKYKPRGTMDDFVAGFASTCPNGAAVCEYFGVEGDPGAYVSYTDRGRAIGRWCYFQGRTPMVLRHLGEREGEWVKLVLGRDIVAARTAGKVLV